TGDAMQPDRPAAPSIAARRLRNDTSQRAWAAVWVDRRRPRGPGTVPAPDDRALLHPGDSHGGADGWYDTSRTALAAGEPPAGRDPAVRRLLGLTQAKFDAVLAGDEALQGEKGPGAIAQALAKIDVPTELR